MEKYDENETTEPQIQCTVRNKHIICGFWRRIFAFIIDVTILGIIGIAIGSMFFDFFAELGGWGRLLGFLIAFMYFGLLNSSIGNGQTIGKRLLKIQVVDKEIKTISTLKSFLRFIIFGVPYFLNGALIPPAVLFNPFISLLLGIIVFFGVGSIVYLYIFNRKTRQSLHDLIAGTFVINTPQAQGFSFPQVWKGHYLVSGLMFLTIVLVITVVVPKVGKNSFFSELLTTQQSIQASGLVHVATVSAGKSFGTTNGSSAPEKWETTYFSVNAILNKRPTNYYKIINKIAEIVLKTYPQALSKNTIIINVTYGYDIGIASGWINKKQQHTPKEWKELLSKNMQTDKI